MENAGVLFDLLIDACDKLLVMFLCQSPTYFLAAGVHLSRVHFITPLHDASNDAHRKSQEARKNSKMSRIDDSVGR